METEGALSAAQVLSPTQPMNKPVRRRMNPSNEEFATNDFRLLIDGRLVEGAATLDVINPATGRVLTTAPRADRGQLEQAVAAAKAAFPPWAATPLPVRGELLVKLADALEGEQADFARLLTQGGTEGTVYGGCLSGGSCGRSWFEPDWGRERPAPGSSPRTGRRRHDVRPCE
jgi:hypothetical protein